MQVIGITGGIGSGKSTVSKVFSTLDIPVYEADLRSKNLLSKDEFLIAQIKNEFGEEAYDKTGDLNRKFLANIVFVNEQKLERLNSLVHPAVAKDFDSWCTNQKAKGNKYVLKEAAILFESGSHESCHKVIVVSAPDEVRIRRVMERDGSSREEVLQRMKNQWPQEKKNALADWLIFNDNSNSVVQQILKIHEQIMAS